MGYCSFLSITLILAGAGLGSPIGVGMGAPQVWDEPWDPAVQDWGPARILWGPWPVSRGCPPLVDAAELYQ